MSKTTRVGAGMYGVLSVGRLGDNDNLVNRRWIPKECPRCFSEAIAIWREGEELHCACSECKKTWTESFERKGFGRP
jgi:hypothetical protein